MKNVLIILVSVLFCFSCKKDEEDVPTVTENFTHGVFVLNEGSFGANNASITHISTGHEVTIDPYFEANNSILGDVLQSFVEINGKGYAVLNNSQHVVVFDIKTFEHIDLIEGLDYPRYLLPVTGNKAYISDGSMAGHVRIVDLATNTITGSIAVGNGPERMLKYGNYVFVCNSGGWATDHTLSIINTLTDEVVETLDVGDRPVDLTIDYLSNLWVICSGETLFDMDWNIIGHTDATMYRVDALNQTVIDFFVVGENGDHPRHVEISPNQASLYYENDGVYTVDLSAPVFPGSLLIGGIHNAIRVNPSTGDIWTAGPADFVSASVVRHHNFLGTELHEYTAGIGTNGFEFN